LEVNANLGFIKTAAAKDLKLGKMVGAEVGGKPVLIVNLEGKYFAIGNVCTHMGRMLSDGVLKRENVQCPCHGSVFDVKTGKVVKGPATKSEFGYQVKVEEDQILINV